MSFGSILNGIIKMTSIKEELPNKYNTNLFWKMNEVKIKIDIKSQ